MQSGEQREQAVRAVFMRGGTSKGLFFHRADLPDDPARRDAMILAAMGSPDPYGHQLDGMGGGLSSLSKVIVVQPSTQRGIDVAYTFGQVSMGAPVIHYEGNCGNLTAAVPVFAIEEGLIRPPDGIASLQMLNLNTGKLVRAQLPITQGHAAVDGEFSIDGVAGSGACIELDFLDPAGSVTGKLLPTGHAGDVLEIAGIGAVPVSVVDAAGLVMFVDASSLDLHGSEDPSELAASRKVLERVEAVRVAGAVAIGMNCAGRNIEVCSEAYPAIMLVSPASALASTSGCGRAKPRADIIVRAFSMGAPHRVVPMADAMCLAVAAGIEGTLVHNIAGTRGASGALAIGHPSGVCHAKADVRRTGSWEVVSTTAFRSARRLMSGHVHIRESSLAALTSSP